MAAPDGTTAPAVIGIDIGGTKALGVVHDGEGATLAQHRRPTLVGVDSLIDTLESLVEQLASSAAAEIGAVGLGIAGLVDLDGRVRRSPNLVEADDFPVGPMLAARLGMPVLVDNDANCAARAEVDGGALQGISHGLLVTLGTGIGGALVCDGNVVRGAGGMAGEPGHMMVDPQGPLCVCGLRGCWERYGSGAGLAHLARQAVADGRLGQLEALVAGDASALRGEHVTQAARSGDPDALGVLDEFSWWVAVGIANCVTLFDPEVVVVGGGLVSEWDLFGSGVRHHTGAVLFGSAHRDAVRIEPAAAGEAAGARGASLLARQALGGA